jgi:DNA-binding PadR family transcriptional regulator
MPIQFLQGTLDLMILRTLAAMGPQHAYGIANRLQQVSEDALNLNQGNIYPALVRIESSTAGPVAPGAREKTVAKRSITPSPGRV